MHRRKEKKTQIHERRRGYIHCGSIEYTLAYTLYYRNVYILVFFRVCIYPRLVYTLDGLMALMHLLYFDEIQALDTCMNDAIMIIIMKNCNDFQVHRCIESIRELEAAMDQGSSRLQTLVPLDPPMLPYTYECSSHNYVSHRANQRKTRTDDPWLNSVATSRCR